MINHIIELFTPSALTGPKSVAYQRACTAVSHAILGAGLMFLLVKCLALPVVASGIGLFLLYILKELNDIRIGGGWKDSVEDAVCTGFGLVYWASPSFPLLALVLFILVFLK